MKKYLLLAVVLVAQLFAMEGEETKAEVVQLLSKQFTGTDGQQYSIHFGDATEIAGLDESTGRISATGKGMHIPRVAANQVRITIVETALESKSYVDFLFAGRIVYGVMPYSLNGEPDARLAFLLDFFRDFAIHHGYSDLAYTENADKKTVWVNPVHAATVVLNGANPVVNTLSFYEAMASLIRESNADLAEHPVISSVDKPFFLMVYSETQPIGDASNKVMAIKLPIDGEFNEDGSVKENRGWKWAIFSRIDGQDMLPIPEALAGSLDQYKLFRMSINS